ncbi:MAG: ferredoxin [Pseudomonadota bacterium]
MHPNEALAPFGLRITGQFAPEPGDPGDTFTTISLVGADGDRMWEKFSKSPEALDGEPDPMDRWSAQVLGAVATRLGATALFPFGGPPWQPFLSWAVLAEGAQTSPVAMQVSPTRGLWMSYRGALGFTEHFEASRPLTSNPCTDCPAPCMAACPVNAFSAGTYNVPACVDHISSTEGVSCMSGCKVRLACPIGEVPPLDQRRFHMAAFVDARNPVRQATGD